MNYRDFIEIGYETKHEALEKQRVRVLEEEPIYAQIEEQIKEGGWDKAKEFCSENHLGFSSYCSYGDLIHDIEAFRYMDGYTYYMEHDRFGYEARIWVHTDMYGEVYRVECGLNPYSAIGISSSKLYEKTTEKADGVKVKDIISKIVEIKLSNIDEIVDHYTEEISKLEEDYKSRLVRSKEGLKEMKEAIRNG